MKAILSLIAVAVAISAPSAEAAKTVKKRILMTYQTKGIRTDNLDLYGANGKYAVQMQRNIKWALKSLPGSTTKDVGAVVIAGKVTARGSNEAVGVRAAKAERKVLMVNMSQYLNRQDINKALRRDIYNATRVNQMIVSSRNYSKTISPYKVLANRVKKLDAKRRYSGEPGEPGPIDATEAEATAPIDGTGPIDNSTVVEVPASSNEPAPSEPAASEPVTAENPGAGSSPAVSDDSNPALEQQQPSEPKASEPKSEPELEEPSVIDDSTPAPEQPKEETKDKPFYD